MMRHTGNESTMVGAPVVICKICGSGSIRHYCRKGPADYYICGLCGVLFQHPVPPRETMRSYADTEYDNGLYQQYVEARDMKIEHFRRRMDFIRPLVRKGRLLDVGCSCGYFLEVAAEAQFQVTGLEFSANAIAAAHPAVRSNIIHSSIDQMSMASREGFDVITAFDIIEHLEHPMAFLDQAARALVDDGCLVVTTPDVDHWLRRPMGVAWPMLQPMQHLTLFSRKAMRLALQAAGFRCILLSATHKVLSMDYLIRQIEFLNPLLFKGLQAISQIVPGKVMHRYRQLNIGEMLVVAAKTPRSSETR